MESIETISPGNWTHVALVADRSNSYGVDIARMHMFINGVEVGVFSGDTDISGVGDLQANLPGNTAYIGAAATASGPADAFQGFIDELLIVKRALSATDVAASVSNSLHETVTAVSHVLTISDRATGWGTTVSSPGPGSDPTGQLSWDYTARWMWRIRKIPGAKPRGSYIK